MFLQTWAIPFAGFASLAYADAFQVPQLLRRIWSIPGNNSGSYPKRFGSAGDQTSFAGAVIALETLSITPRTGQRALEWLGIHGRIPSECKEWVLSQFDRSTILPNASLASSTVRFCDSFLLTVDSSGNPDDFVAARREQMAHPDGDPTFLIEVMLACNGNVSVP